MAVLGFRTGEPATAAEKILEETLGDVEVHKDFPKLCKM